MSEDNNALSRAKKALAVIPSREVATIDNEKIAGLLKKAAEVTQPPAPVRAVETKPAPQPEPVQEAHPPPAVQQPQAAVMTPSPAAAIVEPPPIAPQGQGAAPTVIVNVTTPPPYGYPPPWWAWGWGPGCPAAFCPRRVGHACWRWSCPYW
jgi:hypothetical protein